MASVKKYSRPKPYLCIDHCAQVKQTKQNITVLMSSLVYPPENQHSKAGSYWKRAAKNYFIYLLNRLHGHFGNRCKQLSLKCENSSMSYKQL